MATLTILPAQAAQLAQAVQAAQTATAAAQQMLAILTAGAVPAHATLQDINTDTGELTFSGPTTSEEA